jgi:hypothetical protein
MVPAPRDSVRRQQFETQAVGDEMQTAVRVAGPPKKGSKGWLWAIGAILGVCIVCGGGLVGLFALAQFDDSEPTVITEEGDPQTGSDPNRRLVHEEDFSNWNIDRTKYISSEHRDGAFVLTSADDYYYVILVKGFKTYDASTLLTVRNVSGDISDGGYGLIFHSAEKVFDKDFGFLIRTDSGEFRIVQHSNGKETNLVNWTRSSAIARGTKSNDLEVRADGRNLEFFINGKSVKTLKDSVNYRSGGAGIYTSGNIPVAFSKIEIRK